MKKLVFEYQVFTIRKREARENFTKRWKKWVSIYEIFFNVLVDKKVTGRDLIQKNKTKLCLTLKEVNKRCTVQKGNGVFES